MNEINEYPEEVKQCLHALSESLKEAMQGYVGRTNVSQVKQALTKHLQDMFPARAPVIRQVRRFRRFPKSVKGRRIANEAPDKLSGRFNAHIVQTVPIEYIKVELTA